MLSQSSFNALLKTLEEPPKYVKFILATTDPHKIPVTVLSRCLQFQLKALTCDEIKEQIIKICNKEGIPCEDEAASLIARAASGSMRDALSLCDQAIALGNGSLLRQSAIDMLGTAGDGIVTGILDLIKPNSDKDLGTFLDEVRKISPNYKNLFDEVVLLFHDLALYQLTNQGKLSFFTVPSEILETYAPLFSPESLQLYYQIALQALEENGQATDSAKCL